MENEQKVLSLLTEDQKKIEIPETILNIVDLKNYPIGIFQ